MSPTEELKGVIGKLEDEALRSVLEFAAHEYKTRHKRASRQRALRFRPSQSVKFTGDTSNKLPKGAEGVVIRVNERTVAVEFGEFGRWRVDAALLEPTGSVLGNGLQFPQSK